MTKTKSTPSLGRTFVAVATAGNSIRKPLKSSRSIQSVRCLNILSWLKPEAKYKIQSESSSENLLRQLVHRDPGLTACLPLSPFENKQTGYSPFFVTDTQDVRKKLKDQFTKVDLKGFYRLLETREVSIQLSRKLGASGTTNIGKLYRASVPLLNKRPVKCPEIKNPRMREMVEERSRLMAKRERIFIKHFPMDENRWRNEFSAFLLANFLGLGHHIVPCNVRKLNESDVLVFRTYVEGLTYTHIHQNPEAFLELSLTDLSNLFSLTRLAEIGDLNYGNMVIPTNLYEKIYDRLDAEHLVVPSFSVSRTDLLLIDNEISHSHTPKNISVENRYRYLSSVVFSDPMLLFLGYKIAVRKFGLRVDNLKAFQELSDNDLKSKIVTEVMNIKVSRQVLDKMIANAEALQIIANFCGKPMTLVRSLSKGIHEKSISPDNLTLKDLLLR